MLNITHYQRNAGRRAQNPGTLNLNSWAISLPELSSEWLTDGSERPGPPEIVCRFPVCTVSGEVPRSQQELRGAHAERGPSILVPSAGPGGHTHTCVFNGHCPAQAPDARADPQPTAQRECRSSRQLVETSRHLTGGPHSLPGRQVQSQDWSQDWSQA